MGELAAQRLAARQTARSASEKDPRYDWPTIARTNQLPPEGQWLTWLVLAGRGFGKTRTGAETLRARVEAGLTTRAGLIGPTAADTRDVMVEGESGILAVSPPWFRPLYEPSKRRLTWPNGAIATLYSADEPERLRGPQHDFIWCDEPSSWRYPETYDMALLGLRLGQDPRAVVTGTPKPVKLIRELLKASTTVVTRGSTYDNLANLAPAFRATVLAKYEGTRLGRQELLAELLTDNPSALWQPSMFERDCFRLTACPVDLVRVVVGVDPAASSDEGSAETGIVVAGRGLDGRGYVLADSSLQGTPNQWASAAIAALDANHADRIVAERNTGGEMVESTLRTVRPHASIETVWASHGKATRAEPISSLYEQARISHIGHFPELEAQLTGWVPGERSPDRLDALVWAFTALGLAFEPPPPRRSSRVF